MQSFCHPTRLESLKWISKEYRELNGTHVEVLERPPTALEFSRITHVSRPVVIKGFDVPATWKSWTNEYLVDKMGSHPISVAVTPNGRADAVTLGPDNRQYFAEPLIETMTMRDLLCKLSSDENIEHSHRDDSETLYLQSQNGNVYSSRFFEGGSISDPSEFEPLRCDIPSEVIWCSKAFDRPPDAVNLWIGDSGSVSSIHNDPYENIYTVVRGRKHFTLLPPTDGWCLKERCYPHATYVRTLGRSDLMLQPSSSETPVRWSSVADPHLPGSLPKEVCAIHITIEPGETLYLPAGWWHHVRQSGLTIALNWWYDMEMRGISWVILSFLRSSADVSGEDEDDVEEEPVPQEIV